MSARSPLHWPEYLIEAGLVGVLMVVACGLNVALGHPGSPAVRGQGLAPAAPRRAA